MPIREHLREWRGKGALRAAEEEEEVEEEGGGCWEATSVILKTITDFYRYVSNCNLSQLKRTVKANPVILVPRRMCQRNSIIVLI